MTDDELRALVRNAIARHLGPGGANAEPDSPRSRAATGAPGTTSGTPWRAHPSFGKFLLARGEEDGGACLIEPAVRCNHCGFCQSYGH